MRSPGGTPGAAEYGQMIAWIAQQSGKAVAEVRGILGNGPNGRSRKTIAQANIDWQRTFQKAG